MRQKRSDACFYGNLKVVALRVPLPSLALPAFTRHIPPMSTVVEIKEAIAHLSPQEYCELMADLQPSADDQWDLQMKADASSGKLDFVDRHVEGSCRNGTQVPLEGILEEN